MTEPWLDRKRLADHFSCSVRSIEMAMDDTMPHAIIFGRKKFKASEIEPWLEGRGLLRRSGGVSTVTSDATNGAAPPAAARPRPQGVEPHGN